MEKRRELFRVISLLALTMALFGAFFFLLYDLQITQYAYFQSKMVKGVGRTETVPAARGEITDRYGRPMVSNQVTYQVTLDQALMGEEKNAVLLELMDIARSHSVDWPDGLPLGREAPYPLNFGRITTTARKNFETLVGDLGWRYTDGPSLLAVLQEELKLPAGLSDQETRDLAGVLYELLLRTREVTWSEYVFASGVDIDFISTVRERGLAGVTISPASVRKYDTTYAAHILGRTRGIDKEEWPSYKEQGYAMNEIVGGEGVEKAFESLLRGKAGVQVVERNTKGKIVAQTWKEEPQPGRDVALTIDLPLQQKVEDVLAAKLPHLTADVEGGAAAMVDVHSGAVLALASYPTFDLSVYKDAAAYHAAEEDPLTPFYNRATLGIYPPGSTFKPMVAAAAMEEGIITPSTLIHDTGRYTYYKGYQPQCWIYRQFGGTHGVLNVTRAIEVSCNVFFYDTGRRLGIERLGQYARRFGLGEATGIEIPENKGVVAGPEYTENELGQVWNDGSTLSASIGQENHQFSPIQLANYTATLANGGTRYKVHLLKSAQSAEAGQGVEEYVPEIVDQLELDKGNLEAIKKGMLALTTTGSLGHYFRGLPFQVGAKTGSAQVANSTSNAVFVCFAPYDDPQVALALVAERGGSGSDLAGLAADILSYYFSAQSGFSTAVEENTLLH